MKIDMHLFSLIVALATSVTDGRISSSSSSSSSNRRDLQPALGTHYCTATDAGQRSGVVDWQGIIDQCHKCEGGYKWWPCNDEKLCTGFCTPEAVYEEQLRAAAEATKTPTASDGAAACAAELEEAERLFLEKQNVLDTNTLKFIESSNAENALLLEQLAEKNAEIESLLTTNLPTMSPTDLPTMSLTKTEPVDCDDGYERGDTGLTCEQACDGQCCVYSSTDEPDPEMNDYRDDFRDRDGACLGFTGLVHRDGSCNGRSACASATISEVKGPSCTGDRPCYNLKSSLVTESCNRDGSCYLAEVSLIEGSCNGPEYDCDRIIATSIVNETFDPPQQSVCYDKCNYAYFSAGKDATKGVLFCTVDDFAFQPNYCAYLVCTEECKELFRNKIEDDETEADPTNKEEVDDEDNALLLEKLASAEKDREIKSLLKTIEDLEVELAKPKQLDDETLKFIIRQICPPEKGSLTCLPSDFFESF